MNLATEVSRSSFKFVLIIPFFSFLTLSMWRVCTIGMGTDCKSALSGIGVINRKIPVNSGENKIEDIYLNDGTWFKFEDKTNLLGSNNWKGLINRQKKIPPIITPQEQDILAKGHFKAK